MVMLFSNQWLVALTMRAKLVKVLTTNEDAVFFITNRKYRLFKILGFLTGACADWTNIFATISAVELYVMLYKLTVCDDEAKHESEATSLISRQPGRLLRAWCCLISVGSNFAVKLARMI